MCRGCRDAEGASQAVGLHWQLTRESAQCSVSTHRLYVRVEEASAHVWPCWQPTRVLAARRVKSLIVWRGPMPDLTAKGCWRVREVLQFGYRTDSPSSSLMPWCRELGSSPWSRWRIAFPACSTRPVSTETDAPWHSTSAPQRSILAARSDTHPDTKGPTLGQVVTVS